eukprot:COSAG02_NODE_22871_length_737_cov_1.335423_1_plen_65_part_00
MMHIIFCFNGAVHAAMLLQVARSRFRGAATGLILRLPLACLGKFELWVERNFFQAEDGIRDNER